MTWTCLEFICICVHFHTGIQNNKSYLKLSEWCSDAKPNDHHLRRSPSGSFQLWTTKWTLQSNAESHNCSSTANAFHFIHYVIIYCQSIINMINHGAVMTQHLGLWPVDRKVVSLDPCTITHLPSSTGSHLFLKPLFSLMALSQNFILTQDVQ